ncbi:MAG: hypothetical protein ACYS0I_03080 [Planctomycetota bacterium]|jgi:hypothetical protein
MENKRYYSKTQYGFVSLLFLSICFELFLGQAVTADTFHLKDGSVLSGDILDETPEDLLIDNLMFGQLYILREDIIYRQTPQPDTLTESYTITAQALDVIAHLTRPVPERRPDVNSFNMLIHGSVLSVIDANGLDIPFYRWSVGDSDLITIDYDQLSSDTNRLTIIAQQQGLIREESGLYTLRLKYILDEDTRIRVIIRYPEAFYLETIEPEPKIERDGLIVFDQKVKRQQHFIPEVQFIP